MAYPKRQAILLAGLLAYGGVIEVLQTFTPDPNAALGQIYSYDTNNPKGIAMHVESDYGVVVLGGTANKWARLATGISA